MVDTFQGKPLNWYYVNLDSRPDRRKHAEAQFASIGVTPERVRGELPGDHIGPRKFERMRKRTPGAIGCYVSQRSIIERGEPGNVVAVCEDDVVFAKDVPKRLEYAAEALPDDWEVFYLGATFHVPGEWHRRVECHEWAHYQADVIPTDDPRILRVFGMWGTYAYFVNGDHAGKVLALLEENCVRSDGIDHNFMILGDKVKAYCLVPGMAWQYDNQSNIGDGVTYFSGFKKLGPYVWQDYMEDFDPSTYAWDL